MEAAIISAYRLAWSTQYELECAEVAIDNKGLARIRACIYALALRRKTNAESVGAAYLRTADEFMRAWLSFPGHGDSQWLLKRYHPLQSLADGTRSAQNADLNVASTKVIEADKAAAKRAEKRAAKEIELVCHVPGPEGRRAISTTKGPFAFALPSSVRASMEVSNAQA